MTKRRLLFLACALVLIGTIVIPSMGAADTGRIGDGGVSDVSPVSGEYREGEVLVGFRQTPQHNYHAPDSPAMKAHARIGATVKLDFTPKGLEGVQLVRLPANRTVVSAITSYQADPAVRYAEPNYLLRAASVPDDPYFTLQWALQNTGQSGGFPGVDIDAVPAWDLTPGSSSVVIAVVDSGIDYTHPDLAANIWTNPNEVAGNWLDDDGNGLVDDVRGWDYHNNDNNPYDDSKHGTHCAGIIGAVGNNGIGVAGVMPQVRLMPLKFLGSNGIGWMSNAIECILYARSKGAKVISCSYGSYAYSNSEKAAIEGTDALFVCCAMNDGADSEIAPHYPACYPSANIISVAATDNIDQLASFSNYGSSSVDLAAPGTGIYSTLPGGYYGSMSGTSMATPHVSGVAGLVMVKEPGISVTQVKTRILGSVEPVSSLQGRTVTGGRLNAHRALGGGSALNASFECSPRSGSAPLTVQFADTSTGSPTSWAWSFGDGSTSTARNPDHTYTTAGTYTVSLTVSNAAGLTDSVTETGMITVNEPVTVISITPTTGTQGTSVAITDLAGTGFQSGATVKLSRIGSPDIEATSVAVVSPTQITCQFALSSTGMTGAWNVIVTNADGGSGTLPNGFTVTEPSTPNPTVTETPTPTPTVTETPTPIPTVTETPTPTPTVTETPTPTVTPTPTAPAILRVPGGDGIPTDTNADMLYDDVNGNGRPDFADVVLYFNQMAWIAANEPLSVFDCNTNGRIDFADVVWLFNHL